MDAALTAARRHILKLVIAWAQRTERYADLLSQARTPSARELVFRIYDDIAEYEQNASTRVRKRQRRSGEKFADAQNVSLGTYCVQAPARRLRLSSIVPQGNPASRMIL